MSAGSAGSATFGDLTVLRELGRGGMGVVYLAQGSGGEQVALKTLAVDDERLSGSIRREIAALSRLDHPGIARIVAHGANAQTPWYAMAFERGVTLRSWQSVRVRRLFSAGERTVAGPGPTGCDEVTAMGMTMMADTSAVTGGSATSAATHAAPADAPWISRCLALLRKLCAPLAYLHGEGFVHRDLKPENVVVRSDGSPVVVDFGLATEWTARELREDVDRAADPSGTAIYMAPEQWLGGLVDARTDLYALGCIAYELLTGRPPFHGGSAADLARQHLGATPLPPSALAPAVEKRLDDLVLALLSKRPRDRVGHADTVAERLEALGADGGATAPAPRPRAYLYRADLLGRDDVVARIGSRMKTIGQRGGLLLLRGASGVGKTRLLLHAMELARRLRVPSFTGRCETTGSPLHPLSGFLDRASARCREVGDEETDRVFAGAAPVLAPFASGIARLDGAARELEPLPAPMARLRVFRELGGVLERVARGRPMLVVLDDLQWADELTLAFLESLAFSGRLGSMPVLLAGTVRSEEEPAIVARIARHADCCSVDLEGLGAADVASLVSEMLSDPRPPAALSDLLVRSCAGNPFFVAEALRAAVLGGQLARDGSGRWILADAPLSLAGIERLALPEAMREVVRRRIASLPQSARRVLESAAVLGVECEAEVLRICTGERDDAFAEALWELARRQLLLERQPGILRFDHDKIREAALGAAAPRDLVGLHCAAAHAIAPCRGDDPAAQADLGLHWRRGGAGPRAAPPCSAAGAPARLARSGTRTSSTSPTSRSSRP
ncbi:MAG: protein kinase [Acidobacteriota bacterium]